MAMPPGVLAHIPAGTPAWITLLVVLLDPLFNFRQATPAIPHCEFRSAPEPLPIGDIEEDIRAQSELLARVDLRLNQSLAQSGSCPEPPSNPSEQKWLVGVPGCIGAIVFLTRWVFFQLCSEDGYCASRRSGSHILAARARARAIQG